MPILSAADAKKLIGRRHQEWHEHHATWTWLCDSYEGGHRYKVADYSEPGRPPSRNLFRHSRETKPQLQAQQVFGVGDRMVQSGAAMLEESAQSTYDTRLARTPVPTFVSEVVDKILSKIYRKEINREGPDRVVEWWGDVDRAGTTIDEWMQDTIAPLLIVLGQMDLIFQHPSAPRNMQVTTLNDVIMLGLDKVRASFILPQNLLWWRKDDADQYVECLTQEYWENDDCEQELVFRWWTPVDQVLFNEKGEMKGEPIDHNLGRPPIVRVYDRKKFRCRNVGQSRMEATAERQRDYYNRDSELILNDTMLSAPPLSGPVDFMTAENEIIVGPGYVLPMYKDGANHYQGWSYVIPDRSGDESLRKNLQGRRDEIDAENALTKPAGAVQSGGSTVAQSGVSKAFDQDEGAAKLSKLAKSLAKAERLIAEMALFVAQDGKVSEADLAAIKVTYSTTFNLMSANEQLDAIGQFQGLLLAAGKLPETDAAMLKRAARIVLEGDDDETLAGFDDEIDDFVAGRAQQHQELSEGSVFPLGAISNAQPIRFTENQSNASQTPAVPAMDPLKIPG